ncbi:Glucan endo-1,3-beta-glucosidase-like protein 3 [Platanthera guangdongensis]|uniref:Glucan endo-1,3-beta-glucosidase-like protein 3 n=1 Tax=Platanthera guangdongensis TaxID=2320717 RepID=A0ABR2LKT3_9ASPA
MAAVLLFMIFLAMILGSGKFQLEHICFPLFHLRITVPGFSLLRSEDVHAAWCVCRQDASIPALQKTIDYACGAGADCGPILQNGACYNPNTVLTHCSYAANSYYQRKGQAQGACDFSGTATLTTTDPTCKMKRGKCGLVGRLSYLDGFRRKTDRL